MNLDRLVELLTEDLGREYSHMRFYINAANSVIGLQRKELREFFEEQAASEMKHVGQFTRLIDGLTGGFGVRTKSDSSVAVSIKFDLTDPFDLLNEAERIEREVVKNYAQRMSDCDELENDPGEQKAGLVNARAVHAFVEQQLLDSKSDADEIEQMILGLT